MFANLYLLGAPLGSLPPGNNFQLSLAEVFGEGMVLQQEDINNIWGIGRPFAIVQVEFQDQKVKTEVKPDGRWMLSLKNLAAGGPYG